MTVMAEKMSGRALTELRQTAWLLGQPSLEEYLDFVKKSVDGSLLDRRSLVDEWRAANDYYYELETSEAGIADKIKVRNLDPSLKPLADAVMADQRFKSEFDTVPTSFAMIELDKMIVSQLNIDLEHGERLGSKLGRKASAEELFRFCQPLDRAEPPVTLQRTGRNRYLFSAASNDLRFLEAAELDAATVQTMANGRYRSAMLGLMVGYTPNFLSVIRSDDRIVLQNGHHRAYTLREQGYTHAPCIVETVTRIDELNLVACSDVVESPHQYFKAARPPLLKDFFDKRIRKVFQLPRRRQVVELSFEVRDYGVID